MQAIIYPFLIFLVLFSGMNPSMEYEPIDEEYLSPEYMYHDKSHQKIYIGLASYPGVAVYHADSKTVSHIIAMPTPVAGVVVDEQEQVLYAAAGNHNACLYVYNLASKKFQKSIATGHGPTDIALSKKSSVLFVTNRFNNSISVINIKNQKETKRISADREPIALALSADESLVAAGNLLPSQASIEHYISAKVTLIDGNTLEFIKHVELPNGSCRLKDILFSLDGKYMYVSHLIGRYNVLTNQIEKGWINTNALSVIDANSKELLTTVLLDDIHRGAANPYGLHKSEDGKSLLVAISGTDELFIIDRIGMHARIEESKGQRTSSQTTNVVSNSDEKIARFESPDQYQPMKVLFDDVPNELSFLAPIRKRVKLVGSGPAQIVCDENNVYISSYFSDGLEVVRLDGGVCEDFIEFGIKDVAASQERYGEMLFHSAKNCFQQWQSCASCHPGGGRVDGLNWDLMNDGIGNPKNTKSLLYAHMTPPVMASGIRDDAKTGVRAGFKFIQFFDASEKDAKAVDAYLKSLKPVPSPYLVDGKLSKSAKRGKEIFEKRSCTNCHSGVYFTNGEQYEMGELGKYDKQNRWDTPSLIEIWRTAPYLHDGRYSSIQDLFKKGNHGLKEELIEIEIIDLANYLLSL